VNIKQLISILLARKFIFLTTLLLTLGTTIVFSVLASKQYQASTSIIFNMKGADPVSGYSVSANLIPGYLATQVNVITSRKVALKVVDELNLQSNAGFVSSFSERTEGQGDIRVWIADLLLDNLEVSPSREGSIVVITFTSTSPQFAAVVANSFAREYINTNIELKVEPARQAAEWLVGQVDVLRENVARAQKRLSDYERQKGILFTNNSFDIESAKLNQLSTAQLQSEERLFDLNTKLAAINESQLDTMDGELVDHQVINSLKVQLSRAEAEFAEVKQRLSENHPDYRSAQAEIKSLETRYQREVENVEAKLRESAAREEKRLADLNEKVSEQRERLQGFNEDRNEQEVLLRDAEVAKHVLSAAMERMRQSSLEGQVEQADVAVLSEAIVPTKHAKPRVLVNIILALFLGGILAFMFSLIAEFLDRLVRTKADLEDYLDIPVLSEIPNLNAKR